MMHIIYPTCIHIMTRQQEYSSMPKELYQSDTTIIYHTYIYTVVCQMNCSHRSPPPTVNTQLLTVIVFLLSLRQKGGTDMTTNFTNRLTESNNIIIMILIDMCIIVFCCHTTQQQAMHTVITAV